MWRQKPAPWNRDPDEILSDDEDELDMVTYDNDCTTKLQSLISNEKKVQLTLPVSSRLESLTDKEKNPIFGAYEVNLRQRNSSSPTGKLKNISSDYVIGMNGVQDEDNELIQSLSNDEHHSESCDDSISDEENAVLQKLSVTSGAAAVHISGPRNLESENQHGPCTWSAVIEEAHTLAAVSKKTDSCPLGSKTSEAREVHKGNRGRARPKFSFRPLTHRDNLFRSTALKDGNGKPYEDATKDPSLHNKLVHGTMESSLAELFGNLQEGSNELLMKVVPHDQRGGVPSMAELLEDLQEKDGSSTGQPDLLLHNANEKERKIQYSRKRILPHLGSRILDEEDPPEFSGGGLSSEDEDNVQNHLCVATQKVKGHTMSELFQEAFSRSEPEGPAFPTSKQSGIGYYGRLQQVLQIEKNRHLEFLKHFQIRSPSNDLGSIMDVQILSRFLEAKLTVCQCLFCEYTNSFQSVKGTNKFADDVETRKRTIIFNSKICDNVELEVGNFVRIHSPWKEVQVKEDEKIILCMYFSPLTTGSSGNF